MTQLKKNKVLIIGGPDVNSRIDLVKIIKKDIEFIFTGSSEFIIKDFEENKFKYYYYNLEPGMNVTSDFLSLLSLIKIIKSVSPNIVHTFDTKPGIIGRFAAKLCGIRTIIGTQPGLGLVFSKDQPIFRGIGKSLYQILYKFICYISNITIFQNKDDIEFLKSKKIINEKNSHLIKSSGVDTNFFKFERYKNKKSKLLNRDEINIILISRLLKSKGVLDYCKLAKSLKLKYPQINFNLVGDYQHDSDDSINADALKPYFKFINYLGSRFDIKDILIKSDIMIFPSYYPEGVPRVLIEGASMGLPLVAFKNPGSNEVVFDNVNGYLIEPGNQDSMQNALLKILNNPNLYNEFSQNSRKIAVENFDLKIIAYQYLALYQSFLKS